METINKTWKPVTIGGFTGILMGAGAMHFAQSIASTTSVNEEEQAAGTKSLDDLSFREAFETARADMGPGGVFSWHGHLYNTYTAQEWSSMSSEEKKQFAAKISPEVSPENIDTDQLAAQEEASSSQTEDLTADADVRVAEENSSKPEMTAASDQAVQSDDDDVRVVGFGEVQLQNGRNVTVQELDYNGQRVAVIDLDQDGTADIAMSDLNHNRQMDEGEVIDLHTGEALSFTNDDDALNLMTENFDA